MDTDAKSSLVVYTILLHQYNVVSLITAIITAKTTNWLLAPPSVPGSSLRLVSATKTVAYRAKV